MINMIWAMDENQLIGNGDKIPWHIKEDLLYYKTKTKGQTVLMGEATYHSLKGYYKTRPLPYGKIYVASLNPQVGFSDAEVVTDLDSFLKGFEEDLWIVGGATIYRLSLPYANRLFISYIKGKYEGDTYFPVIDFSQYKLIWEEETALVKYTEFERI